MSLRTIALSVLFVGLSSLDSHLSSGQQLRGPSHVLRKLPKTSLAEARVRYAERKELHDLVQNPNYHNYYSKGLKLLSRTNPLQTLADKRMKVFEQFNVSPETTDRFDVLRRLLGNPRSIRKYPHVITKYLHELTEAFAKDLWSQITREELMSEGVFRVSGEGYVPSCNFKKFFNLLNEVGLGLLQSVPIEKMVEINDGTLTIESLFDGDNSVVSSEDYALLSWLLKRLVEVTEYTDSNLMSQEALAIVFGPNLHYVELTDPEAWTKTLVVNKFVEMLINHNGIEEEEKA
jgi:hypothetical protein